MNLVTAHAGRLVLLVPNESRAFRRRLRQFPRAAACGAGRAPGLMDTTYTRTAERRASHETPSPAVRQFA
jgi:hypothetical protein